MQAFGERELQKVNCVGQQALRGLTQEQMNMFGHQHVPIDAQAETPAHVFQTFEEKLESIRVVEKRLAVITTESNEVRLAGLLQSH
jgi:hypothetical protein